MSKALRSLRPRYRSPAAWSSHDFDGLTKHRPARWEHRPIESSYKNQDSVSSVPPRNRGRLHRNFRRTFPTAATNYHDTTKNRGGLARMFGEPHAPHCMPFATLGNGVSEGKRKLATGKFHT